MYSLYSKNLFGGLVIAGGVAASGFFNLTPPIIDPIEHDGIRALSVATDAQVREAMTANEPQVQAAYQLHVETLTQYIEAGRLLEYSGFVEWIDADGSTDIAEQLLAGIVDLLDDMPNLVYDAACFPGDNSSYAWVQYDNPSFIHFCNTDLYKIEDSTGWHFHEGSHLERPHGMLTWDHTYDSNQCKAWTESDPEKALDTAVCIARFMQSEPPILISRMQVAGALSAINGLLLDVSR